MDEKTRELIGQLKGRMIDVSDGQITEIIREARDEALAEAKAIIKGTMVQAILEHALGELEGARSKVVSTGERVASANETPLPTAQAQAGATESEEQARQEIEAIRTKIAENERLLSQGKASLVETEEVQAPPAKPVLSEAEGDKASVPREEGKEGYGYYVYGVLGSDNNQPVEGLPEEGIDPAYPVYALPYQAIQAIVSKVPLREFGQEELEANLEDMRWLEAKVRAHQRVLETVLDSHTLVPMRFCTIYRSESGVQEMLARHYDDFVEALAHLEGKQEWGCKVYCDGKTLAQRVGEVSDRVKALKAEMEQKSSGVAYFLKKKIDEAIAEEVERISDEYAQRSHNRLSSHAEEAVVSPLQSKEITGRKEAMVLNGAYLVAEERLTAFRAELASLEEQCGDLGFSYEMTGPWTPYNFVAIGFEEGVADE